MDHQGPTKKDVVDVNTKLERLASKAESWRNLSVERKITYLKSIKFAISKLGPKGLESLLGEKCADMKNLPVGSDERRFVVSEEVLFMASFSTYIDALVDSLGVKAETIPVDDREELMSYQKRTVGDQVVADVFPLLRKDKAGPLGDFRGELWFQKEAVKDLSDVGAFKYEAVEDDAASSANGVLVVLGAGNYTGLTVVDVLHGMFVRNRVVFVKFHPLRSFLDDFMRIVFAPLLKEGYIDFEVDMGMERSKAIVYSKHVTSVHMTGGKNTHDMIVWGSTPEQQQSNKENSDPVLKATMTSELGAVTPYIMTDAEYSEEELEHQAKTLISAKWCNGGASCNAPQVVVTSKEWKQRNHFVSLLEESWKETPAISTYYPGAQKRWKAFKSHYPNCSKVVHSNSSQADVAKIIDETHLPLLMIEIDVDLSTPQGRARAQSEYAFLNEAFTPVLIVATVAASESEDDKFMSKATKLSNDCLFGTLSCSIAVPASAEGSKDVERAVADLKYGATALNAWPGHSYLTWNLSWGGVAGESLEDVESGIGNVCNAMFFPNIEKSVLRTPCVHPMHFHFTKSMDELIEFNKAMSSAILGCGDSEWAE